MIFDWSFNYAKNTVVSIAERYIEKNNLNIGTKDQLEKHSSISPIPLEDGSCHRKTDSREILYNKYLFDIDYNNWLCQPSFMYAFDDVFIAGEYATPITSDGQIIGEALHWDSNNAVYPNTRIVSNFIRLFIQNPLNGIKIFFLNKNPSPSDNYDALCILRDRPGYNYFSWMIKHYPKIQGIYKYQNTIKNNLKVVLPPDPPSYVYESLSVFGIKESDIVPWDGTPISCEKLVVPTHPEPAPKPYEWLRENLINRINLEKKYSSKIFISRQNQNHRKIDNYGEVKKILEEYNVEILHPEDLTFREQVDAFHNASVVIGIHGAGMANLIWNDKLTVMEIYNDSMAPEYFDRLSVYYGYSIIDGIGHKYIPFVGQSVKCASEPVNYNIKISIENFETKLNYIIN